MAGTFKLQLKQFPESVRNCPLIDRVEKRPMEPAPILTLNSIDFGKTVSPYFFVRATLLYGDVDEEVPLLVDDKQPVSGNLNQSLNKFNDEFGKPQGFFIFHDLSIRVIGEFRFRFTLLHLEGCTLSALDTLISIKFTVFDAKKNPHWPIPVTTKLARVLKKQGFKLKVRKITTATSSDDKNNTKPTPFQIRLPVQQLHSSNGTLHDPSESVDPIFDRMFIDYLSDKDIRPIKRPSM